MLIGKLLLVLEALYHQLERQRWSQSTFEVCNALDLCDVTSTVRVLLQVVEHLWPNLGVELHGGVKRSPIEIYPLAHFFFSLLHVIAKDFFNSNSVAVAERCKDVHVFDHIVTDLAIWM